VKRRAHFTNWTGARSEKDQEGEIEKWLCANRTRFQRVATVVIIVGLSTLVVLLGMQNNELKEELNRLKERTSNIESG